MAIELSKNDDGLWLHVRGADKYAALLLRSADGRTIQHGPIVDAALEQAYDEQQRVKAGNELGVGPSPTDRALAAVWLERNRQDILKAQGRFKFTCADVEPSDEEKFMILLEEIGECGDVAARTIAQLAGLAVFSRSIEGLSRAILERKRLSFDVHGAELRKELVQVAAISVAWIEALDRQEKSGAERG